MEIQERTFPRTGVVLYLLPGSVCQGRRSYQPNCPHLLAIVSEATDPIHNLIYPRWDDGRSGNPQASAVRFPGQISNEPSGLLRAGDGDKRPWRARPGSPGCRLGRFGHVVEGKRPGRWEKHGLGMV